MRDVTRRAQEHFQTLLWSSEGASTRAYLQARGVTEETARAFGLGWAPEAWDRLAERLERAGLREAALATGLVQPRKKGAGCYDFFRGRVMLPLRSPDGRPPGFGGRLMAGGAEGPKYLNSKDSPLYHKWRDPRATLPALGTAGPAAPGATGAAGPSLRRQQCLSDRQRVRV
ncbi:hypothetical protein HJC10_41680 [Corallococcus exiguus]|nr:hypothetical protein [Corallococcus exiguus]